MAALCSRRILPLLPPGFYGESTMPLVRMPAGKVVELTV